MFWLIVGAVVVVVAVALAVFFSNRGTDWSGKTNYTVEMPDEEKK